MRRRAGSSGDWVGHGGRARATLAAGCDIVLHCNGAFDERRAVADATPPLAGDAKRRADAALGMRRAPAPFDVAAGREEFAAMSAIA